MHQEQLSILQSTRQFDALYNQFNGITITVCILVTITTTNQLIESEWNNWFLIILSLITNPLFSY